MMTRNSKLYFFQTYQEKMELADSQLGNTGRFKEGEGGIYFVQGSATAELN